MAAISDDPQRTAAIARAFTDLAARAAGMSRGWAIQATATAHGISVDDVVAAVMAAETEPGRESEISADVSQK
jgi:hypothetical protein